METVLESLKGISAYPIPLRTLVESAKRRGLILDEEASQERITSKVYKVVKADLLSWLALAPNITQGGQSFSFTDEQRQQFRNQAKALYDECGEVSTASKPIYGYKGSRL
jgi:hypothetical protein|nr:MAG TPA: hypothetical protein [Caudoviricetes sp.]